MNEFLTNDEINQFNKDGAIFIKGIVFMSRGTFRSSRKLEIWAPKSSRIRVALKPA